VRLDKNECVRQQSRAMKGESDGSLVKSWECGDYCSRQFVVCGKLDVVGRQMVV
jgi:hypothetical protein